MMSFKKLSSLDEAVFRSKAREMYKPFTPINGLWHPVYQDECVRINEANSTFVEERRDEND